VCGIGGVATRDAQLQLDVGPALAALAHRGPDASGHLACSGEGWAWSLAHTRLAINDLTGAADQPLANEDETLFMAFNGEIYNSPELRRHCESHGHVFRSRSDGEVILHLWEMEGPAALARLNGIFAVAIASATSGELFLARDPLGVKPLFYAETAGALTFASELRALTAIGHRPGSVDVDALAQFLTFLWIPDPATPDEHARSLEPGTFLRWHRGDLEQKMFAELFDGSVQDIDEPTAVVESEELLRAAVDRQLLSDVPVGIMASGGIDSSLLWSFADGRVSRAFTIEWSDDRNGEGVHEDTRAVRELERAFSTPVDYLPGAKVEIDDALPASGDLLADPAYELTRFIAAAARDHGYKVLLAGQGGDELFAGYRRHLAAHLLPPIGPAGGVGARILSRLGTDRVGVEYAARLSRAAGRHDPFRRYMELCSYSSARERAEVLGTTEAEVADDVVWARHQAVYEELPASWPSLKKATALDLKVYLPGLGLAYIDRAGMEFGVEIRVPWLDLDLVRWAMTLPAGVLVRGLRGKRVPKQLAARVLPRDVAARPKRSFGVPAARVSERGDTGSRFRQGRYFARARRMVEAYVDR